MKKKIIALVPMKAHSERVQNKNLRLFHGKPLYHAILSTLLNSKYITKVVINTDSDEIMRDAKETFGDKVILIERPVEIQGDFVSMNEIIKYDIEQLQEYDCFLQTHSTNPILSSKTIDSACNFFMQMDCNFDSMFSVTRFQTRFYWEDGRALNHNPNELLRTQDLPIIYEENSNFYLFTRESFFGNKNKRIGLKPYLFEIDKIEAVDIDEPEDFIIAEQLYKLKK